MLTNVFHVDSVYIGSLLEMSDEPYIIYSIMWQLNCNGIKINIWFYFFVFQGSIKCKALINTTNNKGKNE